MNRVLFRRIRTEVIAHVALAFRILRHPAILLATAFAARRVHRYHRFGGHVEYGGPQAGIAGRSGFRHEVRADAAMSHRFQS